MTATVERGWIVRRFGENRLERLRRLAVVAGFELGQPRLPMPIGHTLSGDAARAARVGSQVS